MRAATTATTHAGMIHDIYMAAEQAADQDVDLSGTASGTAQPVPAQSDNLSDHYAELARTMHATGVCSTGTAMAVLDLNADRTGCVALDARARAVSTARVVAGIAALEGAVDRRRNPIQISLDAVVAAIAVREDIKVRLGV